MFCELILFNIFLSIFVGPQDFLIWHKIFPVICHLFIVATLVGIKQACHCIDFLLELLFAIEINVKQDCNITSS